MIHLMIVLRTPDGIKECHLFTKRYEPMTFDTSGRQTDMLLYLYHDLPDFWELEQQASANGPVLSSTHCKSSTCYKHVVSSPHRRLSDVVFLKDFLFFRSMDNVLSQAQLHDHANDLNYIDTYHTCSDATSDSTSGTLRASQSFCLAMIPEKVCTVFLNAHVASALLTCIVFSRVFRWCLLRNLRRKFQRATSYHTGGRESDVDVVVQYVVDIVSVWPVQRIDYAWGWCINHILTKRILLEEAMAWLSTLGGAHSSLGEYFLHHAEQAGEISLRQLRLALQLGDPLTVARCHMFWAYSLLQRGHWRKAKGIVRRVYKLASTHCVIDMRLINMCQAAWARIQHLHRVHWRKKRLQDGDTVKMNGAAGTETTGSLST